jgi:hypothetical protein
VPQYAQIGFLKDIVPNTRHRVKLGGVQFSVPSVVAQEHEGDLAKTLSKEIRSNMGFSSWQLFENCKTHQRRE